MNSQAKKAAFSPGERYGRDRSARLGVAALLAFCVTAAHALPSPVWAGELEYKVKSAYIYNFTKFVEWLDVEGGAARKPLKICVVGSDPIRAVLGELSGREANGRPLDVERKDMKSVAGCDLAFISRSEEQQLPSILQRLQGSGTLTVGDMARFARRGGMIGFITENGRVKIEINLRVVRQSGLKVSAKLLEVARVVE